VLAPPLISQNKEELQAVSEAPAGMAESFKEDETVDLNCPVEVVEHSIEAGNSVAATTATIGFRNLSDKKIKALRLRIFCFDPFGESVKHQGDNVLEKNLLDLTIPPKQLFGKDSPVEMKNFNDTRKIKVLVTSVLFSDDTRWDYDGTAVYEIEKAVLEGEELYKLKEAAGDDAVCYARNEEFYWQCICGRANLAGILKCLRCDREKADTLKILSSEKSVSAYLKKQCLEKEAEERKRQEETQAEERRRQEELKRKAEEAEKKRRLALQKAKKMAPFAAAFLVAIIASVLIYQNIIQPSRIYGSALALMETGDYEEAAAIFELLGDYRDSEKMLIESYYSQALSLFDVGRYSEAEIYFAQLGDYRDSEEMLLLALLSAATGADYYIDYDNGTISLGDLPIGARVIDPSWEWEFRTGPSYILKSNNKTKPVTWIVVAKDHYEGLGPHVTLLSEELIGSFPFDDSTDRASSWGSNHWGDSGTTNADHGLRPWLNSTGIHSGEGFYQVFSENFKQAVMTTTVPNREWQNGSAYSTQDNVFIPSTTELGDTEHNRTYQIGAVYPYFQESNDELRTAMLAGEDRRYWTRSPSINPNNYVRFVSPDGGLNSHISVYNTLYGVRPALNLKFDTLVSEIRD